MKKYILEKILIRNTETNLKNYTIICYKDVIHANEEIKFEINFKEGEKALQSLLKSKDYDKVLLYPKISGLNIPFKPKKIDKKVFIDDLNVIYTINANLLYAGDAKFNLQFAFDFKKDDKIVFEFQTKGIDLLFGPQENVRLIPPSRGAESPNKIFWSKIKEKSIKFKHYSGIIDDIMACNLGFDKVSNSNLYDGGDIKKHDMKRLPFIGVDTYSILKFATELFIKNYCGIKINDLEGYIIKDSQYLPYLENILKVFKNWTVHKENKENDKEKEIEPKKCFKENEFTIERNEPFIIELIYNYWHDEGFFGKTLEAIATRFQNIKTSSTDPLARLDIDPLRPLNNILWGYIQDSQHRLNVVRRTLEYEHEYGLKLIGKGIPPVNPVDSRSKFIEAFHNLLFKSTVYHKLYDDMTKNADGFPVLNALKEVHLLLAEGAHNQFGDLPLTARSEILMEQWILARPEIREFLGGRVMYPYTEPWMDRVDTMKTIQGWTDTSISYFNKLATYGEQLILSIRYDNWNDIDNASTAGDWAVEWRNEIQQYIHSYFAVTGVDLSADIYGASPDKYAMPSYLIQRKLVAQNAGKGSIYYGRRY